MNESSPRQNQAGADLTDEKLVGLVLEDQEKYLILMKRYEARLLRYIVGISGLDSDDAEDVLQEAFISTYRNLRDFDTKRKFSSWIYRITRNATISEMRKRQVRSRHLVPDLSEEALERIASDEDISADHDRRLEADGVRRTLSLMPDKHREVLVLFFIEQLGYEEISDVLRLPLGTVSSRLARAKSEFRKQHQEQGKTNDQD